MPCALSKGWAVQQSVHLPEQALGHTGSSKLRFLNQLHEKLSKEIILLCNSDAYSCFSLMIQQKNGVHVSYTCIPH